MHLRLFIADDINQLADSKPLLIGVYTDDILILNVPEVAPQDVPFALANLGLVASVTQCVPGSHSASVSILSPSGEPAWQLPELRFEASPMGSANILLRTGPIAVRESGEFSFRIRANDQELAYPFEIRIQRVPLPR